MVVLFATQNHDPMALVNLRQLFNISSFSVNLQKVLYCVSCIIFDSFLLVSTFLTPVFDPIAFSPKKCLRPSVGRFAVGHVSVVFAEHVRQVEVGNHNPVFRPERFPLEPGAHRSGNPQDDHGGEAAEAEAQVPAHSQVHVD